MAVIQFTVKTKGSFEGNCEETYPMVISCHLQAELICYLCLMINQQWIFTLHCLL